MDDPILSKTDDFTFGRRGEVRTMQVWLQAALLGEVRIADTILKRGLRVEHYRSLLPNRLEDATPEQRQTLEDLTLALDRAVDDFARIFSRKEEERREVIRREGA